MTLYLPRLFEKLPKRYWVDLKRQLAENEDFIQLYEKIVQLKLEAPDGKKYVTDCTNRECQYLGEVY